MMNRREYLLLLLMEECAEIQHRISKMLRFGDITPYANNRLELNIEFNDLLAVIDLLYSDTNVELERNEDLINQKLEKINHYIKDSIEAGCLDDDNR